MAQDRAVELQTGMTMNDAMAGAQVVYARSWQSLDVYGNATLAASKLSRAAGWTVDANNLGEARLMHPMPVRRNLDRKSVV